MVYLIRKARALHFPIDVTLELFDCLVAPVIMYGYEVWGHEGCDVLEYLHLTFCKIILSLYKTTPNCMVYGELGRIPLECKIKVKMLVFWYKIINSQTCKLSKMFYNLV